jgi:hypothetical protein
MKNELPHSITYLNIIILATYIKFRLALIAVPFLTKTLQISTTSLQLTLKAQGNTLTLGQRKKLPHKSSCNEMSTYVIVHCKQYKKYIFNLNRFEFLEDFFRNVLNIFV